MGSETAGPGRAVRAVRRERLLKEFREMAHQKLDEVLEMWLLGAPLEIHTSCTISGQSDAVRVEIRLRESL